MVKIFFVAQKVPNIYSKNNRLINSQIHVFASHCIIQNSLASPLAAATRTIRELVYIESIRYLRLVYMEWTTYS